MQQRTWTQFFNDEIPRLPSEKVKTLDDIYKNFTSFFDKKMFPDMLFPDIKTEINRRILIRHQLLLDYYGYSDHEFGKLENANSVVVKILITDCLRLTDRIIDFLKKYVSDYSADNFNKDFPHFVKLKESYDKFPKKQSDDEKSIDENPHPKLLLTNSSPLSYKLKAKTLYALIARVRRKDASLSSVHLTDESFFVFEYIGNRVTALDGLGALKGQDIKGKVFYLVEEEPVRIVPAKIPSALSRYKNQNDSDSVMKRLCTPHNLLDNRRNYYLVPEDSDSIIDFQIWAIRDREWKKDEVPKLKDLTDMIYSSDPNFELTFARDPLPLKPTTMKYTKAGYDGDTAVVLEALDAGVAMLENVIIDETNQNALREQQELKEEIGAYQDEREKVTSLTDQGGLGSSSQAPAVAPQQHNGASGRASVSHGALFTSGAVRVEQTEDGALLSVVASSAPSSSPSSQM